MNVTQRVMSFFAKLPVLYKIGGVIIVAGAAVVAVHVFTRPAGVTETPSNVAHVSISSVASLSDQAGPLPVVGKVTSVSKASILAVSSGEIVSLSRTLGDHVAAGSVIASFENSSQRAAVLQAQGAYDSAQAALSKASGSTAQNSGVTSAQAAQSAQNAAVVANSALRSAYASLDDAVHTKADTLFSNPHSNTPQLNLFAPNSQLVINIQNERTALDPLIESMRTLGDDPASSDIDGSITSFISKAQTVESFLTDLAEATNKAIPTTSTPAATIATYQATVSSARTETINAISGLTSAKSAYDSAVSGATVASNSASAGTPNDIAAAQANAKSALGALNAAQANLEKTVIRSPISGTIVSLPITLGGYVAAFSPVAQVSNPGALQVETYVTSADAKTLTAGGTAVINGSINGVIVFIAPALDPSTGKIQVKIGVPGNQGALTDGDTVTVSLTRSLGATSKTSSASALTIPIVATKITPSGPVVFTVSSSTLVANPVTFGPIVGSQVTITRGLSLNMDIVTDARGLSDGQNVVVDTTN